MKKLQKATEISLDTANSYEFEQALKLHRLHYYEIKQRAMHCRGEVLTILDAVMGGDERLKPTKDLIHKAFNGMEGDLWESAYQYSMLYDEDMGKAQAETANETITSKEEAN